MLCLMKFTVILLNICTCGNNLVHSSNLYRILQRYHNYKTASYFTDRQTWETSEVGSLMFKNNVQRKYEYRSKNKTFIILYWKYWRWYKYRYPLSPFARCSVNNCKMTFDDRDIMTADAVLIHAQEGKLPYFPNRSVSQRWIFMSDESPVNKFSISGRELDLSEWAGVFNWTMTYRSDSDIPTPYGRTIPRPVPLPSKLSESITNLIPYWDLKTRKVMITVLLSDCCLKQRLSYINELQKYIKVDMYGKCSSNLKETCPGYYKADCPLINKYIFYLAFENSKCRQYITEKTFYNSYMKGSIPIIMGAPKEDCEKLLPPHSFLHVGDYPHPKYLAEEINRIVKNEDKILMYHQWRRYFEVVNEHGYFKSRSYHLCRVCEALNYNDDQPKVYTHDDLKLFFDHKLVCHPPYTVYRQNC